MHTTIPSFYVDAEDANSGSYAGAASTLIPESSPRSSSSLINTCVSFTSAYPPCSPLLLCFPSPTPASWGGEALLHPRRSFLVAADSPCTGFLIDVLGWWKTLGRAMLDISKQALESLFLPCSNSISRVPELVLNWIAVSGRPCYPRSVRW